MTSAAAGRPAREAPVLDAVLDVASDITVNDGFDALSLNLVAARLCADADDVAGVLGGHDQLVSRMLNREYGAMFHAIVDNIERDPLGGKLSHMYSYVLSAIYERPLARAIYALDRDGLNRVMRATGGMAYVPQLTVRAELLDMMKDVGVVRPEVDSAKISAVISAVAAGTALTAPYGDIAEVIAGLRALLEAAVDTDVTDTSAAKSMFFKYAASLMDNDDHDADHDADAGHDADEPHGRHDL